MPLDYTILTQDGTDNTGTDGARDRYFAAGGRDGIIKGSLNEGKLIITPNNGIMMDTCVLLICGNPIIIDEAWSKTFSSIPSTNERHALVAQITVDNNRHKTFDILDLPATTTLTKDKLFKNLNGAGTYQVEIGRFTLTTSGLVENLTRTIDVITGGGTADSELHWGTITAYALGHNEDPEADFEQRYDEEQGYMVTDVSLGIPSGSIDNLDDTLSPTSHNAIENQAVTNALASHYTKTETDNLLNNKADLFNLQQDFSAKTVTIGNSGTNKVIISTPDSTTTYIWAPNNNILIQAGQSGVPNKNIILTPTGNVICKSDLQFEDEHTASVPTPTANNHAVPKSYVDNISTPIGAIIIWSGSSGAVPTNFLLCDGAEISRTTYADLFNIIGTVFGVGDGSTTFKLPDLRNNFPVGAGNLYNRGSTGGSKDAVVVSHYHHLKNNATGNSVGVGYGNAGYDRIDNVTPNTNIGQEILAETTGESGTNKNMPPYLALYYIIRAK